MKKYYFVGRDQKVEIEELEQVVAVRPSKTDTDSADERFKKASRLKTPRIAENQREAFEKAGWLLVEASDELLRAALERTQTEGTESVEKAYRDESDRLLIGSNRLVVKLQPEPGLANDEAQRRLADKGLKIVNEFKFSPNLYEVTVAPGTDLIDAAVSLHDDPSVVYAEPQFVQHIPRRFPSGFVPSDPKYSAQWQWNNTGSNGGLKGADVHAQDAWGITRGSGVKIAIIDAGFHVTHPDLKPAILAAQAAYFLENGSSSATFMQTLVDFPEDDHGTFCAGMAVARASNSAFGCGLANKARLIPIACLSSEVGTQASLARAVSYAADPSSEIGGADPGLGADVISCSFGPNGNVIWPLESVLKDALDFAGDQGRNGKGTPIFWATNNDDVPISKDKVCSHPNVAAVGRSTRNDTENGSAYGPKLEFLAPGVDVASTIDQSGFSTSTGTSFAAPAAAACAALMIAVNADLTRTEIVGIMRATCDKVAFASYNTSGHNKYYGYGRINAHSAVLAAKHQKKARRGTQPVKAKAAKAADT